MKRETSLKLLSNVKKASHPQRAKNISLGGSENDIFQTGTSDNNTRASTNHNSHHVSKKPSISNYNSCKVNTATAKDIPPKPISSIGQNKPPARPVQSKGHTPKPSMTSNQSTKQINCKSKDRLPPKKAEPVKQKSSENIVKQKSPEQPPIVQHNDNCYDLVNEFGLYTSNKKEQSLEMNE